MPLGLRRDADVDSCLRGHFLSRKKYTIAMSRYAAMSCAPESQLLRPLLDTANLRQ